MRWIALFVSCCLVVLACGGEPAEGAPSSGASGAGGAGETHAASACGTCLASACASQRAACGQEPTCAAWMSCVDACPVASGGGAVPACVDGCGAPTGTSAVAARDAVESCGAGAPCAECGDAGGAGGASGAAGAGGAGAAGASGAQGTGGSPPVEGQVCQASTDTDACRRCQHERCCESIDEVFVDATPAHGLWDCIHLCALYDHACELTCYETHKAGIRGYGGYHACRILSCETPPDASCKGQSACSTCQFTMCKAEIVAMLTDEIGAQIQACLAACKGASCLGTCKSKYGANDAWSSYEGCFKSKCLTACQ